MKTLLVAINAKYIHTSLSVRYLYTYCKDLFDIDFVEFTIKENINIMLTSILSQKPDLIGFSTYIWNIEIIKEVIQKIHEMHPTIKILLGGPETSYDVKHFFDILPIDYIISGEGEYPFRMLLSRLNANEKLSHIPNLHYRDNKDILINSDEYVIDVDSIPSPYRLDRDVSNLSKRISYIESSRGCPFFCSYCLASREKHVRYFNINYIKEEILYLLNKGAKTFKFLDRTFNARKDYALEIFKFIIENKKEHCVFQFEITGELLDREVINYLNQHAPQGLFRFEIGIQSTNDLTNKLIQRKQNFSKLAENIRLIQEGNKIDLHLDLIAGLPKEDYESFSKTFNDVIALKPKELQLGFLKLLRGTRLREEAKQYQYSFIDRAPYEITGNDVMSSVDISRIHQAEDILEKYYNSHRFNSSINYITNNFYKNNYFHFYVEFGAFYHGNYPKINYQYHDLCQRLLAFLEMRGLSDKRIISLIKYDYLEKQKTRPKIFFDPVISKEEKQELFETIVKENLVPVNIDTLYRYSLSEKLFINPLDYEVGEFFLLKLFMPKNTNIYIIKRNLF